MKLWLQCGTLAAFIILLLSSAGSTASSSLQSFTGKVIDPSGGTIPNAHVDLYSGKREWHVYTDAGGRFVFPELSSGMYELEVTSSGFRKRVIQNVRIDSSEPVPLTVILQIGSTDCQDSFSRAAYSEGPGESGIKGVVRFVSNRQVTEGGRKRWASSTGVILGATVSALRNGPGDKSAVVITNEKGEFEFANLEPGLYQLKASRDEFYDFAVSDIRVRPGKVLQVEFAMRKSGELFLCQ
ncbi:MAG TPA: carboxypeptidase-like regulatory domain-containing protein [Terriglobales bacterium]